jgi:hypothetical protein
MTGSTGHACPQSGIWSSTSCGCRERIALSKHETFPPCRNCRKAVTWTLIQST